MVRILALDCSGAVCSAALMATDGIVLARRLETLRRGHAERIVPMLSEVLEEAGLSAKDLSAVAATIGPGAFTGIRVGLAAALGLARGGGCQTVGVRVTDAIAHDVPVEQDRALIVALDSRRPDPFGSLFTAHQTADSEMWVWQGTEPVALRMEQDTLQAMIPNTLKSAPLIVGDASSAIADLLPQCQVLDHPGHCDPVSVAQVAAKAIESGSALPASPLYVRAPDVSAPSQDRFRAPGSPS